MNLQLLASNSKYLFILYLVISSNYLGNLFGCKIQDLMTNNFIIKHILGFLTFFFFVTLADSSNSLTMKNKFILSLLIYAIFVLSTKINFKAWVIMILSLGFIYVVEIIKQNYNEEKDNNKIKKKYIEYLEIVAFITAFISLITGFVYYLGEKKIEYKDNFDYLKFFLGNPVCKNNPLNYEGKFIETIKHAFD